MFRKKIVSKITVIVSVLLCFAVAFSSTAVYAANDTQPDATGETVKIKFPLAFFRSEPNLSFLTIKGIFWYGREVKVLGYSGSYVNVRDSETDDEGYIHSWLINDKPVNITKQYTDVYVDHTREGIIKINHDKSDTLKWSVSQ